MHDIPPDLEGFLKVVANIGSVVGQFGFAADALGRKVVCECCFFFEVGARSLSEMGGRSACRATYAHAILAA